MKLGPNQKKWVAALRSGRYEQTEGRLQDENGYCCLGVACIAVSDEPVYAGDYLRGSGLSTQPETLARIAMHGSTGYPTREEKGKQSRHREALKFISDEFGVDHPGCTVYLELASLNDEEGLSFEQIADIIEKFPELYFTGAA